MKKSIQLVEVENEGFVSLLDEVITVMCVNYFYTGRLIGEGDSYILLGDPSIIYETGAWSEKGWSDAQSLPTKELYIQKTAIESFGILK